MNTAKSTCIFLNITNEFQNYLKPMFTKTIIKPVIYDDIININDGSNENPYIN